MTHESEADYVERVAAFFGDAYGVGNAHTDVELPSQRRPDLVVQTPIQTLYIEVENDAESTIPGAGQAVEYAGEGITQHNENAVPVVVSPHWEYPERDALSQFVTCLTVPETYTAGDMHPDSG